MKTRTKKRKKDPTDVYNEAVELGAATKAEKKFEEALQGYLLQELEAKQGVLETRGQLINFLPTSTDAKIQATNQSKIEQLFEEFECVKKLSKETAAWPEEFETQDDYLGYLSTHVLHKEYLYRYNQSLELFETPLPEDTKDHPTYFQNMDNAIQHSKRILELLKIPTPKKLTINLFDKKSEGDSKERGIFLAKFQKDWDGYITKLADFEHDLPAPPADQKPRLNILEKIIAQSENFLNFFESEKINLGPPYYFSLFYSLEDFCRKCDDPAKKQAYLEKFKTSYFAYCQTEKARELKDVNKQFELLSYQFFIQQQLNLPGLPDTAEKINSLSVHYSSKELEERPWINELYKASQALLQAAHENKPEESLPQKKKPDHKKPPLQLTHKAINVSMPERKRNDKRQATLSLSHDWSVVQKRRLLKPLPSSSSSSSSSSRAMSSPASVSTSSFTQFAAPTLSQTSGFAKLLAKVNELAIYRSQHQILSDLIFIAMRTLEDKIDAKKFKLDDDTDAQFNLHAYTMYQLAGKMHSKNQDAKNKANHLAKVYEFYFRHNDDRNSIYSQIQLGWSDLAKINRRTNLEKRIEIILTSYFKNLLPFVGSFLTQEKLLTIFADKIDYWINNDKALRPMPLRYAF